MDARKAYLPDHVFCFLKFRFRFAGKAGQDISCKSGVREFLPQVFHTAQILGRIVPASHPGQNGIAAGLKSQMELRADFIRFPKFCSEFRRSDGRLQRSEPDTLYTGFRLYNPDRVQKGKRRFHILSVGTEMDSG